MGRSALIAPTLQSVDVTIGGRRFRVQCGPGEAVRVQQLARLVDQCAASLIQGQGGMGEEKVLLLSSLMVADRLEEARAEVERLRAAAARSQNVLQERVALAVATAAEGAGTAFKLRFKAIASGPALIQMGSAQAVSLDTAAARPTLPVPVNVQVK